jgi:hypothetical protein
MNCREATIQISLHVGDDLPSSEVPALEEHLEQCAVCQVEYESYASARDALRSLKGEYCGTTDLWNDLEAQLDSTPAAAPARSWYRRPLWAALAAVMVLAVSLQFWMPQGSAQDAAGAAIGNSAVPNLNVGLGIPDVTPAVAAEDGPESEATTFENILDVLRGFSEQDASEEDLDDPMIAAPASRRHL